MSGVSAEQLVERWATLREVAGRGIEWVDEVKTTAPSVANEAEGTVEHLRRVRNLSRRLGEAASKPMSVGFFGLSQAGKSFLISALKADKDGLLQTEFDGQRLEFLEHIDPGGQGTEATGFVTRFTQRAPSGPAGFPIELKLFSETDLVKVLSNAFLNDFDDQEVEHKLDAAHIRKHLDGLREFVQSEQLGGVTEDDIIDLWDYFQMRYRKTAEALRADYWPSVVEMAPRLPAQHRATLFSILWGEIPVMTTAFLQCRSALEQLKFAEAVYAPMECLVEPIGDGGLSKANSIVNVNILSRLGTDKDDMLNVRPIVDGEAHAQVSVSRAQLAVLTVELTFPLVEPSLAQGIENIDLLDFPGYRGRLGLRSEKAAEEQGGPGEPPVITQLLLRGKVAYLFERYTDNQEMNVMVICTPSTTQSEVTEIGPVLTEWIKNTQGETPDVRGSRKPGLVWALTKFDMRISQALPISAANLADRWGDEGLLKQTMLERFGGYSWHKEWAPGKPFNNSFLVRKPRLPVSFLNVEGGVEKGISDEHRQKLDDMRRTFSDDNAIQRHFRNPTEAWDAMMALNDGGISYITSYLAEVTSLEFKLERITEQLLKAEQELLGNLLGRFFFSEGSGESEKKRALAEQIAKRLRTRGRVMGELFDKLTPSLDQLRGVYLRIEDEEQVVKATEENAEAPASFDPYADSGGDDMFSFGTEAPVAVSEGEEAPAPTTAERRFAQAATREWIKQLRRISDHDALVKLIGLPTADLNALIDEMITGALRSGIETDLYEATRDVERESGGRADRLVHRQALVAQRVIGDFISDLGIGRLPANERPASEVPGAQSKTLFQAANAPVNQLPLLDETPPNYSGSYLLDWISAFKKLCIENAGHSLGRDISAEQNDRLGAILRPVKEQTIA